MVSKDTIHGAYHKELEKEMNRVREELKKIGIFNPTKLEASVLIAERSRDTFWSEVKAKKIIERNYFLH